MPQYKSTYNRTASLLVLAGAHGRPLLRLTGQTFTPADLFALVEPFGYHHFDVIQGVIGPKAIAKRHQKLIPLVERRPGLVVVVGSILLLVAIVGGISIFDPTVRSSH